ncbi:helix-turn-helix transcriptional regulator [Cellvibrio mixtus]|uniref:helix-turn-helix transcriptional regulator n=1 Tax=Cellvibrio mixtus TaxID=39650 RepID=UPI000694C5FA|nr:helix-turn-helix domain-containing protein [Cellvibrio mixtus]
MANPTPIESASVGFYRVDQIIELLGISKSTWWLWVQNGKAPKGHKLARNVTVWKRSDIHAFCESVAPGESTTPPEAA